MNSEKHPGKPETAQRLGRLAFGLATLFTLILVIMGITGLQWPKWLLALTTVL
ncbi:MAG: hypothetical protein KGK44_02440 [Gammaproteobacteria bacterium]|nr:hypothetical protein [Gammaproteobacteria bacterium]